MANDLSCFAPRRAIRVAAGLCLLMLLAASETDWLRQGDTAFALGDYSGALEAYARAEPRAVDPGRVAFNKAACLYQLGEYAEAADHYRRSLEDAAGPRRLRASYGLANSLIQQGATERGRQAIETLTRALKSYDDCLAAESEPNRITGDEWSELFADARHNQALARQLLDGKAREAQEEKTASGPQEGDDPGMRYEPRGQRRPGAGSPSPRENGVKDQPGAAPKPTDQARPGKGNLPLLLDDKNAPALNGDQAREHLEAALDRLRGDRQRRLAGTGEGSDRVRDW